ncbi:MAG: FliA/WhiG family RNA polymerase sigma factor [Acidobacteriia bacterium]|nr:FliA/WhiG family RNA polymerase sigma factor [Terriglobia bacterium]
MKSPSHSETHGGARDSAKRQQLLLEHLPEVSYIARRIHERLPPHVPLDDLVHAGMLGLIDAVDKFDPRKKVQLKSYARFRIRGAILDSLRQMDWSPRNLRRQARRIEQAQQDLAAELGRAPQEPELAQNLGMPLAQFQRLRGDLRGLELGSLHRETEDGPGEDAAVALASSPEEDPFHLCLESEMRALVAEALEALAEKEQQVVALYYLKELTMSEVGALLGIGESRVSQIHTAALVRLRARLQAVLQPVAATLGRVECGGVRMDRGQLQHQLL